jgi:hypothetical protein
VWKHAWLRAGAVPSGYARSSPGPVPLPHPRLAAPIAFGSPRCRVAALPHQTAALGGRAVPIPVSSDRTQGNDTGTEPAGFSREK